MTDREKVEVARAPLIAGRDPISRPAALKLDRFPILTLLVCLATAWVFVEVGEGARALSLDVLIEAGAKVGANILELGETWRLLTANFLHRDVLHLAFNVFLLFNLGGAVENAYRPPDYLLIILGAGLGTTVFSLALTPVPSVGASGLVLGLYGALFVAGRRSRGRVFPRYRRFFGMAVVPYTLLVLYLGFTNPETDNWGHLGGFFAGGLVAGCVPLRTEATDSRRVLVRLGSTATLVCLVLFVLSLGPYVRAVGPSFERFEDPASGLEVDVPKRWSTGQNHLGDAAFRNRLGVSLGLRVERAEERPSSVSQLQAAFLDELRGLEAEGELASVRVLSERPFSIEGGRGYTLRVRLESRFGPERSRNLLIERGYHAYRVVLSAPSSYYDAYESVFDLIEESIRLVPTEALRKAQRVAERFPGMASAQVALGRQLASVGDIENAAFAFQQALAGLPDDADALYGLARLNLAYAGNLEVAERTAQALLQDHPHSVSVVTLLVDLKRRIGQTSEACAVLRSALLGMATPERALEERLVALRCGGRSSEGR